MWAGGCERDLDAGRGFLNSCAELDQVVSDSGELCFGRGLECGMASQMVSMSQ